MVGRRCGRERSRDAVDSVSRSASGRGLMTWVDRRWGFSLIANGAANGIGNLVGRRCRRERRRDAGDIVGQSASGHGSIGVVASVGLTALVERRRKRCRDPSWSEPRTLMALGCRQQHGTTVVETWVDRRRGVGRDGESWSSTASSRRSVFVWR